MYINYRKSSINGSFIIGSFYLANETLDNITKLYFATSSVIHDHLNQCSLHLKNQYKIYIVFLLIELKVEMLSKL